MLILLLFFPFLFSLFFHRKHVEFVPPCGFVVLNGEFLLLFERSEFLIATCKKKKTDRLSVCLSGCSDNLLVLVWKNCLGFSVGTSERLVGFRLEN